MSESVDGAAEVLAGEVVDATRARSRVDADADAGDGAAEYSLAPLAARVGSWACDQLRLEGDDTLVARFQHAGDEDWVEVTVVPAASRSPAFHRMQHCAVRYRGKVSAATEERRAEVRALVLGVCAAMDARMAALPGRPLAEALGRSREGGRMVFGRDTLRAMLAPDIVEGRPLVDGWTLVDVYPTSYQRPGSGELMELVLDFRRGAELSRLLFVVSPRPLEKPGFARTEHFTLGYLSLGAGEPRGAATLRALLSFVFQLRDHDRLEVVFPTVDDDVGAARLPAPKHAAAPVEREQHPGAGAAVNLAINAECSQQCQFCSIKETAPPEEDSARLFARLQADLAASRQRGARVVRFNGYDPLAYPRVLELMRFATRLGYERADVFSPCTPLADRAFCREVLDALPPERRFHAPLYAAEAAVHDRVVGVPGAHARLMRALDNVEALAGAASVSVLSVVTRENLHAVPGIVAFAKQRGFGYSCHLPYPSFESRADRYYQIAPRQREVVEAAAAVYGPGGAYEERGGSLPVLGVAPCVALRPMRERGVPLLYWLPSGEGSLLPGTEYRDPAIRHGAEQRAQSAFAAATVKCPHAGDCVLRDACGGEILRAYVDLHGMDEFSPVRLAELLAAVDPGGRRP